MSIHLQAAQPKMELARPSITVMSLWHNDASRSLSARVSHLLSLTATNYDVSWLWAVGDSTDDTEERLRYLAKVHRAPVTVIRADTGLQATSADSHRLRASLTATQLFAALPDSTLACLHESDIIGPPDLLDRLTTPYPFHPVAAWPIIKLDPARFYDIWAYRDLKGRHFKPFAPYSLAYTQGRRFRVGSFGTVWVAPTYLVKGRKITNTVVELCSQWTSEGVALWVDPTIVVEQPVALWSPA